MTPRLHVIILVITLTANLHAAILRGVVRLNVLEGEPLPNVAVSADGAQPTVTESDGRFDLVFANKRAGDLVEIELKKDAYVVIHSILLQHVLLADPNAPRVKVLLAKEGDREEMALRFFRLKGYEAAEKNYRRGSRSWRTVTKLTLPH